MAGITCHYIKDQTEYVNRYSGQCLLPLMAISSHTIPSRKVNVFFGTLEQHSA